MKLIAASIAIAALILGLALFVGSDRYYRIFTPPPVAPTAPPPLEGPNPYYAPVAEDPYVNYDIEKQTICALLSHYDERPKECE